VKRTIRPDSYPGFGRRGVTLVEMLVTVAMLVIIMTILVQVFQAATGALTAATTIQQLDDRLKLLDSTMRSDLSGVTARFTPPLDPAQNLGYFEYGENEFADSQGEDSDDYIRFTAKAPAGRPFTGRMWVTTPALNATNPPGTFFYNALAEPVTVTSEYAEIIYFLRNGNLYRRVLLVAPERQSAIVPALSAGAAPNTGFLINGATPGISTPTSTLQFSPSALGVVSWQGVNDLSARPAASGPSTHILGTLPAGQQEGSQASQTIILNTLGDLTNRENRFAYSRFANDFVNLAGVAGPDGLADDLNADNVPDYYPTLYPGALTPFNSTLPTTATWQLIFEAKYGGITPIYRTPAMNILGFPFVFPGAYSKAQQLATGTKCGWIHAPSPYSLVPVSGGGCTATEFDSSPLGYLTAMNHNPLDLGDNLPTQTNSQPIGGGKSQLLLETTWWAFPTWRETLSPSWTDPTVQVNVGPVSLAASGAASPQQPAGLAPLTTAEVKQGFVDPARALLPAMTALWRTTPQTFTDGAGDPLSNGVNTFFTTSPTTPGLWNNFSWEDDLLMTGVRSFDVKAYDNALGGYGDLGWGDDVRLYLPYSTYSGYLFTANHAPTAALGIAGTPSLTVWPPVLPGGSSYATLLTMAHEGRMPPLVADQRVDEQFGLATYPNNAFFPNNIYTGNIGDDNPGIVRLRRVWDTWSTEYTKAPATGVSNGFPIGPPFSPPVYPSYPAPYPAPLRGIQIQIRVADPTNQRIKSITIRQDFTDKL
jgi:prepilin-type N-terminal cleavage/methylation domain-containing protein